MEDVLSETDCLEESELDESPVQEVASEESAAKGSREDMTGGDSVASEK